MTAISFKVERLFAIFSLFTIILRFDTIKYLSQRLELAIFLWPLSYISETPSLIVYWSLYLFSICALIIVIVWPRRTLVFLVVSWFILLSLENSFGKINHSMHSYYYVSIALFLNSFLRDRYKNAIDFFYVGLTIAYTLSAIWKLKFIYYTNQTHAIFDILAYHVAYALAEGSSQNITFLEMLLDYPFFNACLWVLVIIFQLTGCFVGIFFHKMKYFFLLIFFSFHQLNNILIGIGFRQQVQLIIFFALILFIKDFLIDNKRLQYFYSKLERRKR